MAFSNARNLVNVENSNDQENKNRLTVTRSTFKYNVFASISLSLFEVYFHATFQYLPNVNIDFHEFGLVIIITFLYLELSWKTFDK